MNKPMTDMMLGFSGNMISSTALLLYINVKEQAALLLLDSQEKKEVCETEWVQWFPFWVVGTKWI